VSDRLQLQLNFENLFDTAYYSDAHNNTNISTGAPINGRFTVRAKF
jgi:catecholate siderophore receptor